MGKRLTGLIFLALFLCAVIFLLSRGGFRALCQTAVSPDASFQKIEQTVAQYLPGNAFLRRLQISLKYAGGNKEQNGVFITGDTLMYDVQPKNQSTINRNTLAMIDFAEDYQRPSYAMLIPTACAVQQSKVPYAYDALLYNQKQMIDDVYRRISGHVSAIDSVYPTLRNHQDEYIYYRTENNLTGLGGYYVYSAAAKKLNLKQKGIEDFEADHLDYQFYGDLYQISPYREVSPDRVSAYSYAKTSYSYTVTHIDAEGARRYFTLYPRHRAELEGTMGVLLGGLSPIVDISVDNLPSSALNSRQLLVFGDRTALSYLPFLLAHYARITFVNTMTVQPEMLRNFDVSAFNQVLFAFSVDSFVEGDRLSALSGLPAPAQGLT